MRHPTNTAASSGFAPGPPPLQHSPYVAGGRTATQHLAARSAVATQLRIRHTLSSPLDKSIHSARIFDNASCWT